MVVGPASVTAKNISVHCVHDIIANPSERDHFSMFKAKTFPQEMS
jgi:hypothetical protein